MPVTDQQAAVLRTQLAGNLEEHRRLLRQFSTRDDVLAFVMLTTAAFTKAVRRRFGDDGTQDDAIRFVADVRARSEGLGADIDPDNAERVLIAAFTDGDISAIDPREARNIHAYLLTAMIVDEQLDDAQLDDFIAQSRVLADKLLQMNAPPQPA